MSLTKASSPKHFGTVAACILFLPIISLARSPDFCALDQRKPPFQTLENQSRLTVAELLKIDATGIEVNPRLPKSDEIAAKKMRKHYSPFVRA